MTNNKLTGEQDVFWLAPDRLEDIAKGEPLVDGEAQEIARHLLAAETELQEYRNIQSADREMLKRLAVILSGSDAPGEIKVLTVTAQSFVDRCKQLARERYPLQSGEETLPCPVLLYPGMEYTETLLDELRRRQNLEAK